MKPLEGIKVVDLTTYMATPATGRVLGEWGADVIKVEAAKGDPLRVTQAAVFNMPMSDEENLAFDMCNLHKRFISLNLKSEVGAEVMDKLLSEADVFITNTRTKSLRKMGLDWETLHAISSFDHGSWAWLREEGRRKGRSWVRRNLLYGSWWRIWHYGKSWRFTYDPTNGYGDLQAAMFLQQVFVQPLLDVKSQAKAIM